MPAPARVLPVVPPVVPPRFPDRGGGERCAVYGEAVRGSPVRGVFRSVPSLVRPLLPDVAERLSLRVISPSLRAVKLPGAGCWR